MTYEEIVYKVREGIENADAREIFEHVAVQVNIEGEGSGIFYIEIANRNAIVEPYDYYDRDGLLTADAETLIAIAEGHLSIMDAITTDRMLAIGNLDKIRILSKLKIKKKTKKTAVKRSNNKKTEQKSGKIIDKREVKTKGTVCL